MQKTLTTLLLFLLTAGVNIAQDLFPAKFPNGKYGVLEQMFSIFESSNIRGKIDTNIGGITEN